MGHGSITTARWLPMAHGGDGDRSRKHPMEE